MAQQAQVPVTQRAYTLRLSRAPGECSVCDRNTCECWREGLWATHEAINKGAKVFGDWLLTLRGGLSHELADSQEVTGRDRRLLALSWLSVESRDGAPKEYIVEKDKTMETLRAILKKRKVGDEEIENWVKICKPSLNAPIREDAEWVNRSAVFDEVANDWNTAKARKDAHTLLSFILGDDFLTLPTPKKSKKATGQVDEEDEEQERQQAIKASSKGAGQKTRHLFSHLLGQGKPFGNSKGELLLRDGWRNHIKLELENSTGIPVVDSQKDKGKKEKTSGPAHTELQREMFSKAASRLAQIVTKQRQQEADRLARKEADKELREMESTSSDALAALGRYCDKYRVTAGAANEFRIRLRQITGWDGVLRRWASIEEQNPEHALEARKNAVKEAQDANEEKKFGDVNLFICLADDEFRAVWQQEGKPDPTILERFVKGMKARSDAERLKVATFRHPDPYDHPVFAQFGVSRPDIRFRRLKAFTDVPAGDDPRAVGMLLWHPERKSAKLTLMFGVSKRLDQEIGSACGNVLKGADRLPEVSRCGRFGTAAAGIQTADTPVRVAGVFDLKSVKSRLAGGKQGGEDGAGKLKEPKWNGTLSTNRFDLAKIGKLVKENVQKAQKAKCRSQLRWMLTVSIEMESRGPWFRYVAASQDQTPFVRTVRRDKPNGKINGYSERKDDKRIEVEGWPYQEFNKPLKENKDQTTLVEDRSAARGSKACLILSRLPGLRLLSVDLGHRFAAACAVWETLAKDTFEKECRDAETDGAKIFLGPEGCKPEEAVYVHVVWPEKESNAATNKARAEGREKFQPTTVYRRIGPDQIPGGTTHPAPWARLDRQFSIKLQGEDEGTRKASDNEIEAVHQLEIKVGRTDEEEGKARKVSRSVDELMLDAVRTMKIALRRHGDRARIAFAMTADHKSMPGGKKYYFDKAEDASKEDDKAARHDKHIEFLQDALSLWHDLFSSRGWKDDAAKTFWVQHIAALPEYPISKDRTGSKRKPECAELRAIAEALIKDTNHCRKLQEKWNQRWEADDGAPAKVDLKTGRKCKEGSGWYARLLWFQNWVMPSSRQGLKSIRHVGGLSLTRLAVLTEFRRKVQVGFFTRLHPDGTKTETREKFGQSTLDTLEHLRDQRVKQLSSRIIEAALGVGRIKFSKKGRASERPRSAVDDSCHAVVIESLTYYRPDELHTRRENRQLMQWSSAKVQKHLKEGCQLYGLHLREVSASYTSRQCSRTGLPGVRCDDVPTEKFLNASWWKEDIFLVDLADRLKNLQEDKKQLPPTVRVPREGGDLFVAAPPRNFVCGKAEADLDRATKRAVQADLNAAANIGLRALLDPDWPGRWWYVPCEGGTSKPELDRIKGSAVFKEVQILPTDGVTPSGSDTGQDRPKKKTREIENFWRDVSTADLTSSTWRSTRAYWDSVHSQIVELLRRRADLDS